MAFRLGYVAQNYTLGARTGRTFRLANLSPERLTDAVRGNVDDLLRILAWNRERGIPLFRLASGFVPLASHRDNPLPWEELVREDLDRAAVAIKESGIRISSHPGQYTVLTSPRPEVVAASLAELEYHGRLFDLLSASGEARIILHVGGIHDDKRASLARFASHARQLSSSVLSRLSLEGDERLYTVSDALTVAREIGVPVIVDNLHHRLNPDGLSLSDALAEARKTWRPEHGPQKVHLSSQNPTLQPGAHDDFIHEADWRELQEASPETLDVMVEAKAKDRAVLALQENRFLR